MALSQARREVRRVLVVTLVLNVVVALAKIIIGMVSGALAITADGVHSLIDGSSNVAALFANRLADRPPDDDHPYGHQRYETVAALLIGALLLLTAWEIIGGIIERLNNPHVPMLTPLTFAVLIGTLIINLFVSTYERRVGRRLNSQILLADAANTGADVFVTLSVLVSALIIGATGWQWVDPLAALVIVGLIGRAAWGVLHQTTRVLVDTAPYSPERLSLIAERVPAAGRVVRARSRGSADAAHIDIDLEVAPETTADTTAAIAEAVRAALMTELGSLSEVEVHFVPGADGEQGYGRAVRACAVAFGLAAHEVRLSAGADGSLLELHVEVPPGETLADAHERVSQLEARLYAKMPEIAAIITHIEPALNGAEPGATSPAAGKFQAEALALLQTHFSGCGWHDLRAVQYADGMALALHVTLPAQTTVERAHITAEAAEILLRGAFPALQRVTIHTEPPE